VFQIGYYISTNFPRFLFLFYLFFLRYNSISGFIEIRNALTRRAHRPVTLSPCIVPGLAVRGGGVQTPFVASIKTSFQPRCCLKLSSLSFSSRSPCSLPCPSVPAICRRLSPPAGHHMTQLAVELPRRDRALASSSSVSRTAAFSVGASGRASPQLLSRAGRRSPEPCATTHLLPR
jgi:hypothetical protein